MDKFDIDDRELVKFRNSKKHDVLCICFRCEKERMQEQMNKIKKEEP
jgi:hypothetical protein